MVGCVIKFRNPELGFLSEVLTLFFVKWMYDMLSSWLLHPYVDAFVTFNHSPDLILKDKSKKNLAQGHSLRLRAWAGSAEEYFIVYKNQETENAEDKVFFAKLPC